MRRTDELRLLVVGFDRERTLRTAIEVAPGGSLNGSRERQDSLAQLREDFATFALHVREPLHDDVIGKAETHAAEVLPGGDRRINIGGLSQRFMDLLSAVSRFLGMHLRVVEG